MKKSIIIFLATAIIGCSKAPLTTTPTASVQINGKSYNPNISAFVKTGNDVVFSITGDTFNVAITYNHTKADSTYAVITQKLNGSYLMYSYAMTFGGKLKRLFKVSPGITQNSDGSYTITDTFLAFKTNTNVSGVDSAKYQIILTNVIAK